MHEFQVHRPFENPRSYQLKIGDEAVEAPMVVNSRAPCFSLNLSFKPRNCFTVNHGKSREEEELN